MANNNKELELSFTEQLLILVLSYLQITAQVFIVLFIFEGGVKRTVSQYFELSAKFLLVLISLLLLNNLFIYIVKQTGLVKLDDTILLK